MLKKTFTYTDFNGNERTEDHYFNLTKTELVKMETSIAGGLVEMVNRITSEQDVPAIMKIFDEIIFKSYGVKSADGKRFEKSDKISTDFMQTPAYDMLFMELVTNADAAAAFINGVIPSTSAANN